MRAKKHRHLLLALLMLVFAGQVFALSNISCQNLPVETSENGSGKPMVDHSHHKAVGIGTETDESIPNADSECCFTTSCSMSSCVTAIMPVAPVVSVTAGVSMPTAYVNPFEYALASTLFRPPISR